MKMLITSALAVGFLGATMLARADCPANFTADQTVQCLRDQAAASEQRLDFDVATALHNAAGSLAEVPLEHFYAWSELAADDC